MDLLSNENVFKVNGGCPPTSTYDLNGRSVITDGVSLVCYQRFNGAVQDVLTGKKNQIQAVDNLMSINDGQCGYNELMQFLDNVYDS